ncbi:hypothetical protein M0Q97_02200 [Candidatus Dojkabacteria bacterium]|jgi:hypothetical protein|nr:hypothetical protein [Candidatus Dojkabacteria bacterium]
MENNKQLSCIKEKRFLFWKWKEIKHTYKPYCISKFMKYSSTFHVEYKCSVCGATKERSFVEQDELLLLGIPLEVLNKITDIHHHYIKT